VAEETLPSPSTVERQAATLEPPRPTPSRTSRLASLRSVRNWQQLGKFCAVGAVGYLINLAVYDALLHAGLHYLLAATCSFLVAVTSNYTWNRLWTFREHRGHVGIQGMRFLLVSLAALGANLLVLDVLVNSAGVDKLVAQAIAIVVVTPLNFVGNKLWSFRRATP
jgi:putative flippase GtrA